MCHHPPLASLCTNTQSPPNPSLFPSLAFPKHRQGTHTAPLSPSAPSPATALIHGLASSRVKFTSGATHSIQNPAAMHPAPCFAPSSSGRPLIANCCSCVRCPRPVHAFAQALNCSCSCNCRNEGSFCNASMTAGVALRTARFMLLSCVAAAVRTSASSAWLLLILAVRRHGNAPGRMQSSSSTNCGLRLNHVSNVCCLVGQAHSCVCSVHQQHQQQHCWDQCARMLMNYACCWLPPLLFLLPV